MLLEKVKLLNLLVPFITTWILLLTWNCNAETDSECAVEFMSGQRLVIGEEQKSSVLTALKADTMQACAEFCCEFDFIQLSTTPCGAALYKEQVQEVTQSVNEDEIIDDVSQNGHNCYLLSCKLDLDCASTVDASFKLTTIRVGIYNTSNTHVTEQEAHVMNQQTLSAKQPSASALDTSSQEDPSASKAALITLLVCVACFGVVGGVVTGHYFYQQYQKRKLYYKLDRMESNGDFFTSDETYNFN